MTNLEPNSGMLCTINYDISDLRYAITESANHINSMIGNYKMVNSIFKNTPTNDNAMIFAESAGESIINNFIKVLKTVRDFIISRLREIRSSLSSFFRNNDTEMKVVIDKLDKRFADGDFKAGPEMKIYRFSPEKVKVPDTCNVMMGELLKSKEYDYSTIYANPFYNTIHDISNDTYKEPPSVGTIKYNTVSYICKAYMNKLTNDPDDISDNEYKDFIRNIILNDGKKVVTKFNKDILDMVRPNNSLIESTTNGFNNIIDILNDNIKSYEKEISQARGKIESGNRSSAAYQDYVVFNNHRISILNAVIHTLVMVRLSKIQATLAYINDCKKFCILSYQFKEEVR